MKRLASILTVATVSVASLAALAASPLPEFSGPIESGLVLDTGKPVFLRLKTLTAQGALVLPAPPAPGDRVFGGMLTFPLTMRFVLVEPREGVPSLYADRNRDGKLTAEERFPMPPDAKTGKGRAVFTLALAASGPLSAYPADVTYPRDDLPAESRGNADRLLLASLFTHVEARVPIDGKPVLVRYSAIPHVDRIDPQNGVIEMDLDGNGSIEREGPELDRAQGYSPLFRIGERYVSLQAIDLAAGKLVLKSHPASDYKRWDLSLGSTVPDFSFVDLDGKTHKLSDWRGRYVLLDFWATWCAPCIGEFPTLKKTYEEYRPHGFDIIGVIFEDKDAEAGKLARAKGLPWLQATAASTGELARDRFRIVGVPVTYLLDPQGKVVSAGRKGEPPLEGEELAKTLAGLLPAKGGGGR